MAGFVHALVVRVERGRRQHADGTGQHGSLIRQDVAEHVVGDHHVELLGRAHQLHGGVIHVHMGKLDVRVVLRHLFHHFPPQLAGGENVGLVHRAEPVVAYAGHVETDAGDTTDFALAVRQGVVGLALAVLQHALLAGLAEVDAAGQFADDEDVQPGDHFRLQAGGRGQLRIEDGRTQVGEQAQLRANLQQTALGTDIAFDPVPFRPPYRAQQHRIGLARALQGLVGQRHAVLVDGRATDDVLGQFEAELEPVVGQFQHLDRFRHDFRADTVTGENQDLLAHNTLLSFIH